MSKLDIVGIKKFVQDKVKLFFKISNSLDGDKNINGTGQLIIRKENKI